MIQWQIDWEAIISEMDSDSAQANAQKVAGSDLENAKLAAAQQLLLDEFKKVTLETLVGTSPDTEPTLAALVQVSALDDHYIEAVEGQNLYDILCNATAGPCCIEWISGGHATCIGTAGCVLIRAVCADHGCVVSGVKCFVPGILKAFAMAATNAQERNDAETNNFESSANRRGR